MRGRSISFRKSRSYLPGLFCYRVYINGYKYPRKHGGYYLAKSEQDAVNQALEERGSLAKAGKERR